MEIREKIWRGDKNLRLILLSRDLDICQSGGSCGTIVTKILSSANWADFVAPNARGLKKPVGSTG